MKRIIFVALMAASAAWGTITSDVITCRIQVNSSTRATILSLPLTELGASANSVDLKNVVLTDNLEDGTFLFAAINGETHAWKLQNGAWIKFEAVDGFAHTSDTSAINSFTRGMAFWIERAGDDSALAKPFYIYGKVEPTIPAQQTITGAVVSDARIVPAYTRIGNPNPEDRDLNDLVWSGRNQNDKIIVSASATSTLGFIEYSYNQAAGKWGIKEAYKSGKVMRFNWNYDAKLYAGQGFWYVRNATGTASVSFQK